MHRNSKRASRTETQRRKAIRAVKYAGTEPTVSPRHPAARRVA